MKKYSEKASDKVGQAMHEEKKGTLKMGRSGKKVTDPKQAIAIGLSEARAEGADVPPPPKKSAAKKGAPKKTATKKAATKSAAPKKAAAKKMASKKASAKKSAK